MPFGFNSAVIPSPVFPPVIRQPPSSFLTTFNKVPIIQIGASGGTTDVVDPNWGGCQVFVAADGVTYARQDDGIFQPSRIGLTVGSFASYGGSNPDTTSVLIIDFGQSGAVIASGADADASMGRTLLWVGNEILGYTSAVLIAPFTYQFTRLWRALYGTTASGTSAGTQCMRIDEEYMEISLPSGYSGHTLNVKLPSFNIFNQQLQSLATCIAYPFTVT